MTCQPTIRKRRSPKGFSLVEVTLAIGIVAFIGTAILWLFSTGVKTNYDSRTSGTIAQIVALSTRTYPAKLQEGEAQDYTEYYTYDGIPVPETDPNFTTTKYYTVRVQGTASAVLKDTSENLHLLTISITTPVQSKPRIYQTSVFVQ